MPRALKLCGADFRPLFRPEGAAPYIVGTSIDLGDELPGRAGLWVFDDLDSAYLCAANAIKRRPRADLRLVEIEYDPADIHYVPAQRPGASGRSFTVKRCRVVADVSDRLP